MALTENTRDYEILVRFNPDGTVSAHRQSITEVHRDGELVAGSVSTPVRLTVAELKSVVEGLPE